MISDEIVNVYDNFMILNIKTFLNKYVFLFKKPMVIGGLNYRRREINF